MSRMHSNFDVYVGEDLTYTLAMILDQHEHDQIKVRTRNPEGGQWEDRLVLTDAALLSGSGGTWVWEGENPDGELVRITAVRRAGGGCASCGK